MMLVEFTGGQPTIIATIFIIVIIVIENRNIANINLDLVGCNLQLKNLIFYSFIEKFADHADAYHPSKCY